jgi:uncharacterized protein (DUF2267 family)
MSISGFGSIEHAAGLTREWVNELDEALGWNHQQRSYCLLHNMLQAIHNWLPADEAARLGAQLATLRRGVCCDHWRPAAAPAMERDRESFVARIDRAFETDPIDATARVVPGATGPIK